MTAAGVRHHVALSVVGTDRLPDSGYLRAKVAQEKLISDVRRSRSRSCTRRSSSSSSAASPTRRPTASTVRLPPVLFQPVAAATSPPRSAGSPGDAARRHTSRSAGPEQFRSRRARPTPFSLRNDAAEVVSDPHAPFFGGLTELSERSLIPETPSASDQNPLRRLAQPADRGQ